MIDGAASASEWKAALARVRERGLVHTRLRASSEGNSLVTREALDKAYDEVRESVDLVADVPEDGCYARAEVLCQELRRRGLESEKVFVTPLFGNLRTEGMAGKGWRYHVATVALTSDQGAQVLDPLLYEDPLPLERWFSSIWRGGVGVVSIHEPSKYLNGITFSRDSAKHEADALQTLATLR